MNCSVPALVKKTDPMKNTAAPSEGEMPEFSLRGTPRTKAADPTMNSQAVHRSRVSRAWSVPAIWVSEL